MNVISNSPRRTLRTVDAARYLGVSASLLRKMRMRGPEDPRGSGPSFIRLSPSLVVYEIDALDRWLDAHVDGESGDRRGTSGCAQPFSSR